MPNDVRSIENQIEEYKESRNFIGNTFAKLTNLTHEIISDYRNGMYI
jgi:hypothetical protein